MCLARTVFSDSDQKHPDNKHINDLRQIRNRVLLKSSAGTRVTDWYYRYGPRLARAAMSHKAARVFVKIALRAAIPLLKPFSS
jgi:hypothetical protein